MGMGGQCCDGIGNVEELPYRRIMWVVLAVNAAMFFIEAGAGLGAKSVA